MPLPEITIRKHIRTQSLYLDNQAVINDSPVLLQLLETQNVILESLVKDRKEVDRLNREIENRGHAPVRYREREKSIQSLTETVAILQHNLLILNALKILGDSTVIQIAERVGRSMRFVYGQLKTLKIKKLVKDYPGRIAGRKDRLWTVSEAQSE